MRAALALWLVAVAAAAQPVAQRMIEDAEAPVYNAVGRLNVAGNRHCTATLIDERLVLTAAHCLYNELTGRRAGPGDIRFVAGQRRDDYVALREVVGFATPPGYEYARAPSLAQIEADLALLALAEPIAPEAAAAIAPADWSGSGPVAIVAYGRERAYVASIREGCGVAEALGGVVVLDCAVTFGVSGAPVLAEGPEGPELIAVVSAMGEGPGGELAYVVPVAGRIEALRAALVAQ